MADFFLVILVCKLCVNHTAPPKLCIKFVLNSTVCVPRFSAVDQKMRIFIILPVVNKQFSLKIQVLVCFSGILRKIALIVIKVCPKFDQTKNILPTLVKIPFSI